MADAGGLAAVLPVHFALPALPPTTFPVHFAHALPTSQVVALDQIVWLVLGALAAVRDRQLGSVPLNHKWGGRSWLSMSTVSFVSFVSAVFVVFPT